MGNNKLNYKRIKSICLLFIFSIFFTSCNGQVKTTVSQEKIAASRISKPAENLPEFKTDPYVSESQGNQISGVVRTIFQDKNGNYWFGTQNGLCSYDGKSLVYFDIRDIFGQTITVKAIAEDTVGNIWIGHSGGLTKYDGKYFTNFTEKDGLVNNDVWCVATDKNDKVWIGTLEGVCYFDGKSFTPLVLPEGKPDPTRGVTSAKMIHSILEDSGGRIWFGTNGGVYIYDGKFLSNISEKDGLHFNFVNAILEDKDRNFWIATDHHGLLRFTGDTLTNVTEGILDDGVGVGSILEDKKGNIWFNASGRDLYRYNRKDFTKYRIDQGDFGPATFQIYQDQQERLWFVGFNGAYRYDKKVFVNITRNGPW